MKGSLVATQNKPPRIDQRPLVAILLALALMAWQHWSNVNTKSLNSPIFNELQVKDNESLYLSPGNSVNLPESLPPAWTPLFFFPVPINQADRQLLQTIPGIGPGIAEKIIQWREVHGPLRNRDDLLSIPGIGRKRAVEWGEHLNFSWKE